MNNKNNSAKTAENQSHESILSQALLKAYDSLSMEITQRKHEAFKELITQHDIEWSKLLEYTHYDLSSLVNAISSSSPQVFKEYIDWVATLFQSNNIPLELLKKNITIIEEVIRSLLPVEHHELVSQYMKAGISEIDKHSIHQPTYIDTNSSHGCLAEKYLDALLSANRDKACQLILDTFSNGVSIRDIYLNVLQPVQYEIGRLWHLNKISVAQEHYASSVTQLVMTQLYPSITLKAQEKSKGIVVAVCVSGELHEIGIRMVADFFEMDGWTTHFLGANMPMHDLVETLLMHKPDLLAISASMSSNLVKAKSLIKEVHSSHTHPIKVMVGGYVFNNLPDLWKQIGADYFAEDADAALRIANHLLQEKE